LVWFLAVFPELGAERRLEARSTFYPAIADFRDWSIRSFRLERPLLFLEANIRKIFLLGEKEAKAAVRKTAEEALEKQLKSGMKGDSLAIPDSSRTE
jgi:hypothetical protein